MSWMRHRPTPSSTAPSSPVRLGRAGLFLAAAFLCLVCSTRSAEAAGTGWSAGSGREKITPPAGLWMTGYASRDQPADGTAQDLWVKALAVADPTGRRGVLLTLDLCGITREISDHVAAELGRRHSLPRSAVMVNVSHTHCSPFLNGNLSGLRILPPEGVAKADAYATDLKARMIRAAEAALASLAPATISWGEDEATFGFNRRENAEKQVPELRAAGKLKGPFEPRVPVLAVHAASGELRALLVSYACHNTTLGINQWHGDYAGSAQVELEKRHPGATVLFAIGCGADINPAPRREPAHAEQHGRALADAADRALARKLTPVDGRFGSAFEDITLRFSRLPTEEELRTAREKQQANREMHQAWAAAVAADIKVKGDRALEYAYPIQAWSLGNVAWVALGGEVVIDYSIRLRRELGPNLWVFGYSTDVMAYIPSERVLKEGRYEGDTSMVPYGKPAKWTAGLEEKIVTKTHELVKRSRATP
ncbi:MAG: neutral/alkaline non-lysosomal ceramidase N-terminal domain-containing protein [Opitutaceae bacterium]|nr:neutral/alkaline non-lysosomal ceramidase N-terminal domain-containing protein [Opitutaceae bacterium]